MIFLNSFVITKLNIKIRITNGTTIQYPQRSKRHRNIHIISINLLNVNLSYAHIDYFLMKCNEMSFFFLQKMKDGGGTTDEKSANIDFDSLRGLSDLGVDMSFLDNMGMYIP